MKESCHYASNEPSKTIIVPILCPNLARAPVFLNSFIFYYLTQKFLPLWFQRAFHHLSKLILTQCMTFFCIFCPLCPYMENWHKTPRFLNLFEFYYLTQKLLPLRFRRAITHLSKLISTRIIFHLLCENITGNNRTTNMCTREFCPESMCVSCPCPDVVVCVFVG